MPSLQSFYEKEKIEAGLDEAGRGCLAGPVVAAAVILPKDFYHPKLNDSKQLSEKDRYELEIIIRNEALAFGIGIIDNLEIDKINILKASFRAMNVAVGQLKILPDLLMVDGNRFIPEHKIPFKCFVKGDARFSSIAAASILAKTYRDKLMIELGEEFPHYKWQQNKGYPTLEHRKAILKHGITPFHRLSFHLIDSEEQLNFDFK